MTRFEVHNEFGENVSGSGTGDFATRAEAERDMEVASKIRPDLYFDIFEVK